VLPTTNGTDAGEEHEMSKAADISEPASELERLIADLSARRERITSPLSRSPIRRVSSARYWSGG